MPELEDYAQAQADDSDAKQALNRALRNLDKAKASRAELVDAVYRAARDGISGLEYGAVVKPKLDRRKAGEEVAVAVLSDWQLAKETPDYSSAVCEERIELYADKVAKLTEIQRADHPVNECHVWILGDIVEGELIFPGQAHEIDASLYRQVTIDGPRILGNFLRRMCAVFPRVEVTAVIGNHGALGGRSRREYDPESNADRMLYRVAQLAVQEPGLRWNIPDGPGRNWYAVDDIGGYRTLLFHGDQVRGGFAGFPWYGFAKKVWGWKTGAIAEPFDDAFCGHWHQPTRMTLNTATVRVSGSPESSNPYAQEQLAAVGRPSQWLLYARPGRGITSEYCVWLD